jgi:Carboxypeptidase regulatory-like domain
MGKERTGVFFVLAALLAALAPAGGSAAALSGDLRGKIMDAEQKPVAGAAVTLLHAGKPDSKEQATDASGNFSFKDLTSGVYIATVALEGYAPVTCPGVRVVSGARQVQITLVPDGGEQTSSCQPADN